MSFNADKKSEHEKLAESALASKDYVSAFFHTSQAAGYTFSLAEQSDGKLARTYLDDANELLEIAQVLKSKAKAQSIERAPKLQVKENGPDAENQEQHSKWKLVEKPDVRLDDVAGLDEVKTAIREDVVDAFLHPEVYQRFKVKGGGGVLMYGPPGNGKTFIAKAIAGELDAAFFAVDSSVIKDKYVGETEKNMRRLFEEAATYERAVIFFDEIDALLSRQGSQKVNAVTQFLILTDGIVSIKNCLLLLGATNKPWSIDQAALRPGRFGKLIYVGLPDAVARESILKFHFAQVPLDVSISYSQIAQRTEGYSGADLAEVCRYAKKKAIRRQISSSQESLVTNEDIDDALRKIFSSVSHKQLEEYTNWRKGHRSEGDSKIDEAGDAE
jgi:transitional endoplasmic reticulum ATPase